MSKRSKRRKARQRRHQAQARAHESKPNRQVELQTDDAQIDQPKTEETEEIASNEGNMTPKTSISQRVSANGVIAAFTVVIAVIAAIQAGIYHAQLKEMRLDQRAWVAVKYTNVMQPTVGKTVPAPMFVANIGKTVAKHFDGWVYLRTEPIDGTIEMEKPGRTSATDRPLPAWTTLSTGVLYPNDPISFPQAVMVQTPVGEHSPRPFVWDEATEAQYARGDVYLAVSGRITYRDVGGVEHWTTFCAVWTSPTSQRPVSLDNQSRCNSFNSVDDNE